MKQLSYRVLREQQYPGFLLREAPEKVLQFGEGNFLRAFVDHFVDIMNETADFNGKVAVVQPISHGMTDRLQQQEGLYTLLLRGVEEGRRVDSQRVISSISRGINPYKDYGALLECAQNPRLRFLVSNTTEAGIVFDAACRFDDAPPASFPAKLARFLYERYTLGLPGFVILSCELIDNNGAELKRCVMEYVRLWELEDSFARWVEEENIFCSTLVDRIVTGYPRNEAETLWSELGYRDDLLDIGEVFGLWVIEGPASIKEELPFEKAGLPILVVDDHTPYKQQKVRILNGAHTAMSPAAWLADQSIVREAVEDPVIRSFLDKSIWEEIIPNLTLPKQSLDIFAKAVIERFLNPYVDHSLLSITLNTTAKWKARVMPSLLAYYENEGELPPCLTFSFAAYLEFYRRGMEKGEHCLVGRRGEDAYRIQDDDWVLDFFYDHRDDDPQTLVHATVENRRMWGDALASLEGFESAVAAHLERIAAVGAAQAMKECVQDTGGSCYAMDPNSSVR